ncbi:glycosyltransferase family 4 protein [Escherichia coli]|uniref:glycosyltransferase family 4 protein n=1 Tax=Escherichia coli TaxID=562 RepID=UPI002035A794|nr:glycosyltransferase family 4 protein [Escherichia coli]
MDGVRWFTKEVLPFLNKHGNFEFKVIGRITDKDKSWLESQPGVVVTGEVDSITYAAADGHIGVCPIRLGQVSKIRYLNIWRWDYLVSLLL